MYFKLFILCTEQKYFKAKLTKQLISLCPLTLLLLLSLSQFIVIVNDFVLQLFDRVQQTDIYRIINIVTIYCHTRFLNEYPVLCWLISARKCGQGHIETWNIFCVNGQVTVGKADRHVHRMLTRSKSRCRTESECESSGYARGFVRTTTTTVVIPT